MQQRTGDVWWLGRRPELDGLRGIAIGLVVLSHLSPEASPWRKAGLVGVVVFFALSGFLITTLLMEGRARSGRVDLRDFYRARVFRLAPALLVCVAVVSVLGVALGRGFAPPALVVGALTWSSNWIIVSGDFSGTALTHTWSLAIEEQFYVVWPLVVLLLVGRRKMLVATAALGVFVSVLLRLALVTHSASRVMNGSDTRADSLLVGCLLALAMVGRVQRRSEPGLAALGLAFVGCCCFLNVAAVALLVPLVAAAATAAVIFWSVQDPGVPWLAWGPLVFVGRRSYGLYLWHWPVILVVERLLHLRGGLVVALVALPLSALVTELSWRHVEKPFLARRHRERTQRVPSGAVALERGAVS